MTFFKSGSVRRKPAYKGTLKNYERTKIEGNDGKIRVVHEFTIQKGPRVREYTFSSHSKLDFTDYFVIGEKVKHYEGFDIPQKDDLSGVDAVVCIDCGERVPMERGHCPFCGNVVIK